MDAQELDAIARILYPDLSWRGQRLLTTPLAEGLNVPARTARRWKAGDVQVSPTLSDLLCAAVSVADELDLSHQPRQTRIALRMADVIRALRGQLICQGNLLRRLESNQAAGGRSTLPAEGTNRNALD